MKSVILLVLSLTLSVGASELSPSEAILKIIRRAHDMNQGDVGSVDYKMVLKSDKTLTEEKILELFRSIDPAKVSFAADDSKSGTIEMIQPMHIRFTYQSRASSSDVITSVASHRVIVRMELDPNSH